MNTSRIQFIISHEPVIEEKCFKFYNKYLIKTTRKISFYRFTSSEMQSVLYTLLFLCSGFSYTREADDIVIKGDLQPISLFEFCNKLTAMTNFKGDILGYEILKSYQKYERNISINHPITPTYYEFEIFFNILNIASK